MKLYLFLSLFFLSPAFGASGESRTHYEILGVPMDADSKEIETAFKKRRSAVHPDKNPDNPKKAHAEFVLVNNAYQILSNPIERRNYDQHLKKRGLFRPKSSPGPNSQGRPLEDILVKKAVRDFDPSSLRQESSSGLSRRNFRHRVDEVGSSSGLSRNFRRRVDEVGMSVALGSLGLTALGGAMGLNLPDNPEYFIGVGMAGLLGAGAGLVLNFYESRAEESWKRNSKGRTPGGICQKTFSDRPDFPAEKEITK